MVLLLSVRRMRGPRLSREQRRDARRLRRSRRGRARGLSKKAERAGEGQGVIRLPESEEEHGEMLPSYAEGEQDRLVEKV